MTQEVQTHIKGCLAKGHFEYAPLQLAFSQAYLAVTRKATS